jgi:hypothetical protein
LLTPSRFASLVCEIPFANAYLRNEGSDLIEAFDVRKLQLTGLQLIVFPQFLFELPDHAPIATPDSRGALAWLLLFRVSECLLEARDLSQRSVTGSNTGIKPPP